MTDKIQEIAATLIETASPATRYIKIGAPIEDNSNKKKNGKLHYKSTVKFKGIVEDQVARISAFHLKSGAKYKKGFIYFDADSKADAVKRVREANSKFPAALGINKTTSKTSKSSEAVNKTEVKLTQKMSIQDIRAAGKNKQDIPLSKANMATLLQNYIRLHSTLYGKKKPIRRTK